MYPERLGIVMLTAVGDAVHVLPLVTAVKRHSPSTHITWVVQPGPASLVRGHPAVDEILLFERGRGWRAYPAIRRELARRPFDVVLAPQSYLKAGLVTALTRAPAKLGFDRARARDFNWLFTTHQLPPRPRRHLQDELLEFLDELSIPREPLAWELGPWPEERGWQHDFVARFDRPIAALVIGSSKPEKDWLAERWAAVSDLLVDRHGLQPVLIGAASAREIATERVIMERARHRPVSMLDCGLRRAVGIIDAAALVVSLDTGPLHIAVALNRPVISLMGYANPKRVGPYRRFRDLLVDAYGDPGEDYPISLETRPGRMPRIRVEDVAARLEVWEHRYRSVGSAAR